MDFGVASFRSGSDLSYFEHLCMKSFVDNGYTFYLFTQYPPTTYLIMSKTTMRAKYISDPIFKAPICAILTAFIPIFGASIYFRKPNSCGLIWMSIACALSTTKKSFILGSIKKRAL